MINTSIKELIKLRKDLLKFRYDFDKKTKGPLFNVVQKAIDLVNMQIGSKTK